MYIISLYLVAHVSVFSACDKLHLRNLVLHELVSECGDILAYFLQL